MLTDESVGWRRCLQEWMKLRRHACPRFLVSSGYVKKMSCFCLSLLIAYFCLAMIAHADVGCGGTVFTTLFVCFSR